MQGNHCMQYMVAVVFVKGAMVDIVDYQDDSPYAQSKQVSDLRAKIKLFEDREIIRDYRDLEIRSATNTIKVSLNDGTVLNEVVTEFPLGSPNWIETLPLCHEKAKTNLALMLNEAGVQNVLSSWESNGYLEKGVSSVLDLFVPELPN